MAAKKAPAKKQGKGKAYAPVPKGYKANWNVPKGTPWKKNSPYNPANQVVSPVRNSPEKIAAAKKAAAKKAAAAKVKAKTTAKPSLKTTTKPPAKKVSSKKPVVGKDGLTDYQRKLSYAGKVAGNSKTKLKPYDAKWAANAKKEGKRTKFDKIAEKALEFSPLGGLVYGAEAITGKSFRGPLNKPAQKTGRLAAAANAAFYMTPVGAAGKIKKGVQTVRGARNTQQMLSKGGAKVGATKETAQKAYVNNLVAAEIAKYKRELAKKNKGK